MTSFKFTCFSLLLLLASGCGLAKAFVLNPPDQKNIKRMKNTGLYALDEGSPATASAFLEKSIAKKKDPEVRLALVKAYLKEKKYRKALKAGEPLVTKSGYRVRVMPYLAFAAYQSGLKKKEAQFLSVYFKESDQHSPLGQYLKAMEEKKGLPEKSAEILFQLERENEAQSMEYSFSQALSFYQNKDDWNAKRFASLALLLDKNDSAALEIYLQTIRTNYNASRWKDKKNSK